MDKEKYSIIHKGILFSLYKEGNPIIYSNMDEPAKRNKPDRETNTVW